LVLTFLMAGGFLAARSRGILRNFSPCFCILRNQQRSHCFSTLKLNKSIEDKHGSGPQCVQILSM
jgi:hypothetical protein